MIRNKATRELSISHIREIVGSLKTYEASKFFIIGISKVTLRIYHCIIKYPYRKGLIEQI